MNFSESVTTCFNKYADFDGRASRSEFWWWMFFISVAPTFVGFFSGWLAVGLSLATLVPSFAVSSRRLHDVGRSGWWQLFGLVPVIGWIMVIVWLCEDSKPVPPSGS